MVTEKSQRANVSESVSEKQKLLNNNNNNNNSNKNDNDNESKKSTQKTILKSPKDLIVKVEDKSPTSNTTTVFNTKDKDYMSSMKSIKSTEFNSTMSLNTKQAKLNKKKSSFSRLTCYLLNQYVTYMILCLVIILGSFAYYYLNMSINLKVEDVEKRLNKRIFSNMQMKLYMPDDENVPVNNMEEIDSIIEKNHEQANHNEQKNEINIYNKKNPINLKLFMSKNYVSSTTYFVLKKLNQSDFMLTPINIDKLNQTSALNTHSENVSSSMNQDSFDKPESLTESSHVFVVNDQMISATTRILGNDTYINNSSLLFRPVENDQDDSGIELKSELETNSTKINSVKNTKNNKKSKLRHRKRLGLHKKQNLSTKLLTETTTSELPVQSETLFLDTSRKCKLDQIDSNGKNLVFMGVFHCSWMIDPTSLDGVYYIAKSYKGSSLTICQNLDELKSNRCYKNMRLKFPYYGTGNVIYKGHFFYYRDNSKELVVKNLINYKNHLIPIPDDAECCDLDKNLYSVKHSGFFDFEVDENGLWLIYKMKTTDEYENETYVIAKIDENEPESMRIVQKWHIKVKRNNVANIFITCGQVFALKDTISNPAVVYNLCDLFENNQTCSGTLHENQSFNLNINTRQLTYLSYDSSKTLLQMVDGGSFINYKMQLV